MEDTPRRRLERKSGSSSRSPSLTRRPSLKDKKVSGTIAKVKGKKSSATGSKKERWLLTRKTWRYMSDAVGNLLPESHRSTTATGSGAVVGGPLGTSGSGGSTRRTSSSGFVCEPGPSSSSSGFHVADIPGGVGVSGAASRPKSMPTAIPAAGTSSGQQSKASSTVTSPTYGGIMSFPSHRPGVTPTGPGPGKALSPTGQSQQQHILFSTDKFYPPSDDIPTLEKHFEAVCNKEKRFLLWTRTKPKGLSGPALRDAKMKQQQQKDTKGGKGGKTSSGHRDSSGSIFEALHMRFGGGGSGVASGNKEAGGDYYSPTTEEDDDYDEYDEDEITVRERRKSSTASSTMSMLGTGQGWTQGSIVLRPLSTLSSHGSESSYSMVVTQQGVTKICRNTGTQTDPFPEELLIRFRLQAVQEERQQQLQQRQISPDNQSDATTVESPMSPVRLDTTQKVSSPPPTTTASPMSPTTSTDGVRSSGSGRESQEKLLETTAASSTRPSLSGQSESMATTKGGEGASTSTTTTTTSATTDKKSEESGYSSSISDTVMRYLRMVRKNSKADNKDTIDKFKTVNYDRSLRYIKSKNVTVEEALEHEKNKEAQKNQKAQELAQQQAGTSGGATPETGAGSPKVSSPSQEKANPVEESLIAEKINENDKTSTKVDKAVSEDQPPPSSPTSAISPVGAIEGQVGESGDVATASTSTTGAPPQSPVKTSRQQSEYDSDIPPSSPPPPPPLSPSLMSPKEARTFTLGSPPPPVALRENVSSSVGIQCGESLIRFLRTLNPNPLARKMSDFSSSCCSSESPVEMFSPRYSFATTGMSSSDTEMFGGGLQQTALASMMALAAAKGGVPQTPGGTIELEASPEFDDVFQGMKSSFFQKQRQQQIQHPSGEPLSSSWSSSGAAVSASSSTTQTTIKKSSSVQQMMSFAGGDLGGVPTQPISSAPIATTSSSSSYSLSQLFHYSHSKSFRSRDRDKTGGSGGGGTSPDAASTPATPTTSSMGGSGGLMKTFFGSSPFSSTFGLKKSGLRKPTSTTSLTCTTNTGSDSISGRGMHAPPPTTSSSPNLLSLIQSSAASAGTGFTNLFSSSSRSGSSITSTGASRGGGGGGVAPTQSSSAASSSVMQKSKSSSSVLPLYGSSGSVSGAHGTSSSSTAQAYSTLRASPSGSLGGESNEQQQASGAVATPANTGGGGSRLISKTNKLFKSRSKSSTRANTSSSSAACTWSPQGRCKWKSVTGKVVTLEPTSVLSLSEVERLTLQDVALEKLRALNLGVDIKIPKEKSGPTQQKPKRRPYLLKKKALSTGFFESGKREDAKESSGGGSGLVFGIALSQCVANDRLREIKASTAAAAQLSSDWEPAAAQASQQQGATSPKRSQNGSRNSVSSVVEMPKDDKIEPTQSAPTLAAAVPVIVTACINHLENYGLHTTGIFRVSTSLKRIRQLREDLDSGKDVQFGENHSPHDVAALLKEFLRDLPEPLLSRELYQAFLKTQKIRNRKLQLEAIQHLVQLLPVANRDTLAALLKFFAKVVAHSSETRSKTGELLPGNKMEGYSLATLIAPNILPCMPTEGAGMPSSSSIDQNELTKERRESIDLVNYMISNFGAIFDVTPELLHDVYLHLMDTNPEAIEGLLRTKIGNDEIADELETTSSVFEESEGGETIDCEEAPTTSSRVYRRREEILHEGAGRGGTGVDESRTRERRPRRDESGTIHSSGGAAGAGASSDTEKPHSGGESDSSTGTKSTSRWFRRSRGDAKGRTSSDSGSEKVKGSRKRESSLFESKRASSLDSVNVPEPLVSSTGGAASTQAIRLSPRASAVIAGSVVGATAGGMLVGPGDIVSSRPFSGSDQSLRVPEHLMSTRRQSSPVLESSGIITASLKIPVPVPLNIDDTDIPYIEDENSSMEGGGGGVASLYPYHHHHHHLLHHQSHYQSQPQYQSQQQQQSVSQQKYSTGQYPYPYHQMHMQQPYDLPPSITDPTNLAMVRCRSMSTDSSVPLKTTSSSVTTTPISSPARQPSSEISSPTGFSPPTSPPLYGTFPIEEMTARMLIGSAAASSTTPSTVTALSTSPSMHQFHHHGGGAITMTTPSGAGASSSTVHQYQSLSSTPSASKDPVMETKSASSTPVTRPKIDKTMTSGVATSATSSSSSTSSTPTTARPMGSSPHLIQKSHTSSGQQGAIASLAIGSSKVGEMGTKSATSSQQPAPATGSSSMVSSSSLTSYGSSNPQPSSSISPNSHTVPPVSTQPSGPSGSSPTPPSSSGMMLSAGEPKGLGKETKGANIGGLIKSKTADFEKLQTTKVGTSTSYLEPPTTEIYGGGSSSGSTATTGASSGERPAPSSSPQPSSSSSSSSPHHQIYSIAPKMRLRSQENVLLKQQFLLRQQQQHQQGESNASRRERVSLKGAEQTTQLTSAADQQQQQQPGTSQEEGSSHSGGGRPITRRRLLGSASSSAIMSSSSGKSTAGSSGGGATSPQQRVRSREPESGASSTSTGLLQIQAPPGAAAASPSSSAASSTAPPPSTSPSRWKRSEIIASRQQSQPSSPDPETFV